MEYARFLALRERVVERFQASLERARRQALDYQELERLAVDYRQVLHLHSLATTRFPGTAAARELRRLAVEGTRHLLQDDRRAPSVRRFFTHGFPQAIRAVAPAIAVCAALFSAAALIGFALATIDLSFGTLFVGTEALAGLRRGELWTESIFSSTPAALASGGIARNNLTVALTAFAGGTLAGLGALHIALLNGVLLGSVLALTAHYGVHGALLEFIAAHGPLEISLILVASGAGLHLGRALLVADDEPRSARFARAGQQGALVMLGSLPFFLVLGFVEGYVSPSSTVPIAAKVLLGLLLEALFLLWALLPGERPGSLPMTRTTARPGETR